MGGLSPDPQKRERQLEALRAGRRVLAERELSHGDEPAAPPSAKAPAAKAPAKASQGSADPDRIDYPKPPPEEAPAHEPTPEPTPAARTERRGFVAGLLGRLD